MKKVCYLLNHPNDIPWAILLKNSKPKNCSFEVFIINFASHDKYNWGAKTGKGKSINPCIQDRDMNDIISAYGEDTNITVINSEREFHNKITDQNFDVAVSRGKEFFIFREFAKKSIALSMDRSFFVRLLHALPYYKNLKIYLQNEKWVKKDVCGNFCMAIGSTPGDYNIVNQNLDKFEFIDIMGHYKNILDSIGKEAIRSELGIKQNEKIAFLNFRKASAPISIHRTNQDFFNKSRDMIEKFKSEGYKILSRERLDKENINWDAARGMSNAISHVDDLIDTKLNGHGGYPPLVFRAVYASDIIISADVSGICTKEGLVCRTPVFLPFDDFFLEKIKEKDHLDPVSPIFVDMVNKGIITNTYDERLFSNYNENVEKFVSRWYNTDIDLFWKKALN